ncbi:LPS-assembly protein LptD [Halioxenophilus sp. WMMB6]|uniref:LPS-assembly protein LptD n=1 Tax=Halioxenophilus sp. WMMB6 TaxID=3073815 RepID=UPI00295F0379|nr:LPS-assembly protein LptD [Halioxenophilus sp. WMMB6]
MSKANHRRLSLSPLPLCVALASIALCAQAEDDKALVDWVSPSPASADTNPACPGYFVAPAASTPDAEQDPGTSALRASADRSRVEQDTVILEGDVQASQGGQSLSASKLIFDRTTGTAEVSGDVIIRDEKSRIAADRGYINNSQGTAELNGIDLVDYTTQMRTSAERLSKHRDTTLHLTGGSLTTCPPGQESWRIEAESIDIGEQSIWGVAKNPVFRFKDIPVFWLPFMTFPASQERLSGFLYPTVGFSDNGGLDLALPYYFNLAPNYDLLLSPRYINDRGAALEGQFRHLSHHFESTVDFAGLKSDRGIDDRNDQYLVDAGIIEPGESNPFINQDRWLLSIDQEGGASRGEDTFWFSTIDFTRVSDQNYFRDINNTAIDVSSRTHVLRYGDVGLTSDHWLAKASTSSYQTLDYLTLEPYQELPKFNLNGHYYWSGISADFNHEWVRFDQHNDFDRYDRAVIRGNRTRLAYDLTRPMESVWGFFTPGLHLKHLAYTLDDQNLLADADTEQSFSALQGSLDAGLFFERESSGFKGDYTQTFEPRLYYFYSDYVDQSGLFNITADGGDVDFDTSDITFSYNQLFRNSRFAGGDRIDDDNRLSVGLTSRFIDNATGRQWLSASLGQIFYFADRRTFVHNESPSEQNRSFIAGELTTSFNSRFNWATSLIYDEDEQVMSEGRTALRYLDDRHRLLNIGYTYRRRGTTTLNETIVNNDVRQSDISFILPLSEQVNFIGRNLHDFTFDRELDTFSGLEYNSCCYRARLVWRRWISNDLSRVVADDDLNYKRGIFFDIQFKGFGGSTGKYYKLMSDTIPGFTEREQAVFPD